MSFVQHHKFENTSSIAGQYSLKIGMGFLRIFLLFGTAAAMLGLILVPLLMQRIDRQLSESLYPNLPDQVITGSVTPGQ